MAIWQFRVVLVPQSTFETRGEPLPVSISSVEVADQLWWSKVQPPEGFERQIDLMSPEIESWSEEIRIWGSEDTNDAHVCYTDASKKVVEEIAFRLDVRDLSPDLVRMICALAQQLSCVLLTADSEILRPVQSEVLAAIRNSTAAKFVSNPATTLRNLGTRFGEVTVNLKREEKS